MRNPLKNKPRTKETHSIPAKPDWLKVHLRFPDTSGDGDIVSTVRQTVGEKKLNTVCESASCPNLNHCWSRKTATYMLGGDICTRRCSYCDVAFGKPKDLDAEEPIRVANSVRDLGLNHVVITSVNRDDLPDGGATHFANTVREIRKLSPNTKIELLVPDFSLRESSLSLLYASKPDLLNHNLETVERLFPTVARQKNYATSLGVLRDFKTNGFQTKSGIILGLGETRTEIEDCLRDLRNAGVDMITIGQYMQPTPTHYPVQKYWKPKEFSEIGRFAKQLGFSSVMSGPLVRSSYYADKQLDGDFGQTG